MLIEEVIASQKKTALLFLDMEFTGFENNPNDPWEIGWLLDVDGTIVAQQNHYISHRGVASAWVLKNTMYNKIFTPNTTYTIENRQTCYELLLKDLQAIDLSVYDIYIVGAAVEGDFRVLKERAKEFDIEFPIHWRSIDLSSAFYGYMFAKGHVLQSPLNVNKMMKILGLKSDGKKHTTNTDNEDLRNVYYALKGNAFK